MDEIYTYEKTFEERLQDCMDVLYREEGVVASAVQKEWSYFIEMAIDPIGWRALWKVPKSRCKDLGISYPNVVLVFVLSVDFNELNAKVKIEAVQSDIHLPETVTACLINLFPLKQQDESIALNMRKTAECLDTLRFFYNHIWLPWDNYDDENEDWPKQNLKSRIRFYFDMKSGLIPPQKALYIRDLINEAVSIQNKIDDINENIEDEDELEITDVEHVKNIFELQSRLTRIKTEFVLYENPAFMKAIILNESIINKSIIFEPKSWLVFGEGSINVFEELLKKMKDYVSSVNLLQSAPDLKYALQTAHFGDNIFLGSGNHKIHYTGSLECGGKLVGIDSPDTVRILSNEMNYLFDFSGGDIIIENLTLEANNVGVAIVVRKGHVKLKNCKIIGNGALNTRGIVVSSGALIELENCEIYGFCENIVLKPESRMNIKNILIHDCYTGIRLISNAEMVVENCVIYKCKEYGVYLESVEMNIDVEDTASLNLLPGISIKSTIMKENSQGNVGIYKPMSLSDICENFPDISQLY